MEALLSNDQIRAIYKQGCKVTCPICDKRVMSQSYQAFHSSGVGQHIRSAHPDYADFVITRGQALARADKQARKAKEAAIKREMREAPLRVYTVTGAFLEDVVGELHSLVGMMEPYYSQCDGDREARCLIDRIEAMQSEARRAAHPEVTIVVEDGEVIVRHDLDEGFEDEDVEDED